MDIILSIGETKAHNTNKNTIKINTRRVPIIKKQPNFYIVFTDYI